MLSQKSLEEFAAQFRTDIGNVMREYLQNILLSHLYRQPHADRLAFKGGTALRLLYRSPRFSEDLDFSSDVSAYRVKTILAETLSCIKGEAIPFSLLEAKETSGGYLAVHRFVLHDRNLDIEWNISLRNRVHPVPILVTTPIIPYYQCMALPPEELAREKMEALFRRKKPRDFFDLYFLLRERLGLQSIIPLKKRLLKEIGHLNQKKLKQELKIFLPLSHHSLLNHFPQALTQELTRL